VARLTEGDFFGETALLPATNTRTPRDGHTDTGHLQPRRTTFAKSKAGQNHSKSKSEQRFLRMTVILDTHRHFQKSQSPIFDDLSRHVHKISLFGSVRG